MKPEEAARLICERESAGLDPQRAVGAISSQQNNETELERSVVSELMMIGIAS